MRRGIAAFKKRSVSFSVNRYLVQVIYLALAIKLTLKLTLDFQLPASESHRTATVNILKLIYLYYEEGMLAIGCPDGGKVRWRIYC